MTRVVSAILFAVVLAGCGGAAAPANSPTPSAASTPTAAPTPTSKALGFAAWLSSVQTDFDAMQTALTNVQNSGAFNATKDVALCQALQTAAQTLQGDRPIPDPTLNSLFQDALTKLAQGASACVDGISTNNPSLLEIYNSNVVTASSDMAQVLGQLKP